MSFTPEQIAEVCHEANRALQRLNGEVVNFPWESTTTTLRYSVIDGVKKILSGEVTEPWQSHENWINYKLAEGWTYGPVKDFAKKEHPDLVPYGQLPPDQKVKDALFFAIIKALA